MIVSHRSQVFYTRFQIKNKKHTNLGKKKEPKERKNPKKRGRSEKKRRTHRRSEERTERRRVGDLAREEH